MLLFVIGLISVKWPRVMVHGAWQFKNPQPHELYLRFIKISGWLLIVFSIATMIDGLF